MEQGSPRRGHQAGVGEALPYVWCFPGAMQRVASCEDGYFSENRDRTKHRRSVTARALQRTTP